MCHLNLPLQHHSFLSSITPPPSHPLSPSQFLRKQLAPFDVWLASHQVTTTAVFDRVCIHAVPRTIKSFSIRHPVTNIASALPVWPFLHLQKRQLAKITKLLWLFGQVNDFVRASVSFLIHTLLLLTLWIEWKEALVADFLCLFLFNKINKNDHCPWKAPLTLCFNCFVFIVIVKCRSAVASEAFKC